MDSREAVHIWHGDAFHVPMRRRACGCTAGNRLWARSDTTLGIASLGPSEGFKTAPHSLLSGLDPQIRRNIRLASRPGPTAGQHCADLRWLQTGSHLKGRDYPKVHQQTRGLPRHVLPSRARHALGEAGSFYFQQSTRACTHRGRRAAHRLGACFCHGPRLLADPGSPRIPPLPRGAMEPDAPEPMPPPVKPRSGRQHPATGDVRAMYIQAGVLPAQRGGTPGGFAAFEHSGGAACSQPTK